MKMRRATRANGSPSGAQVAFGQAAIRALAVKRGKIGRLDIEELEVGRLHVKELVVEHEHAPRESKS
jgi:hypothetical protein